MADRIPTRLSATKARSFGFTVGGAMLALSAVLYLWRHRPTTAAVIGAVGAVLVGLALVQPAWIAPVERWWMAMAHAISKVTTPIVMTVLFFAVIVPVGALARVFGRRALVHRAVDDSYWQAPHSGGRSDMERQF